MCVCVCVVCVCVCVCAVMKLPLPWPTSKCMWNEYQIFIILWVAGIYCFVYSCVPNINFVYSWVPDIYFVCNKVPGIYYFAYGWVEGTYYFVYSWVSNNYFVYSWVLIDQTYLSLWCFDYNIYKLYLLLRLANQGRIDNRLSVMSFWSIID